MLYSYNHTYIHTLSLPLPIISIYSRMERIPVTIAVLGLLYCKTDVTVGQDLKKGLNLIDLSLLPLTPILGSGSVSY